MARRKSSLLARGQQILNRYRTKALGVLAIAACLFFLFSAFFPEVEKFVLSNNVLPILTFLVLVDIAVALDGIRGKNEINLLESQDQSMPQLLKVAARATKADLLEYAAQTPLPLIRSLRDSRVPIRLLIQHPDLLGPMQRSRTLATLDTLYHEVFEDYDGEVEIRCYRLPFTLRGRFLYGKVLELGWLTPDLRRQTAYGHGNPTILIEHPSGKHEYLLNFFGRTFNDYWEHADTEAGKEVLARLVKES